MNILKQAKAVGIAAVLAVLAGCAGQVNEQAASSQGASKVESAADKAAREARQEAFLAASEARKNAMAADTLFFFEFDKSDLKQAALDDLDAHAKYLSADRAAKVRLEGHADERGTRAYNLALGERRANTARNYLIALGVAPTRISTISYGKERPAVPGSNEMAWSQNRRGVTKVE